MAFPAAAVDRCIGVWGHVWDQFHKLIFGPCRPASVSFGETASRNGCGIAKIQDFRLSTPSKPEKRPFSAYYWLIYRGFSPFFAFRRNGIMDSSISGVAIANRLGPRHVAG